MLPDLDELQTEDPPSGSAMDVLHQSDSEQEITIVDEQDDLNEARRTSDVWTYMVENPQLHQARCKKCSKVYNLGAERRNGTSTMLRHVRKCYGLNKSLEPVVPTMSVLAHFATISPAQKRKVMERILEWIVMDQQALSVVEHPAFKAIFSELPGRYHLPCHKTIRAKAFERFQTQKDQIKSLLSSAPGNIALTCDGWSSSNHQHYLGITAHWVDKDWKLQRAILDFVDFPLPRSASAAKNLVKSTMESFDIVERVQAMVTDNTPSAYNISELLALDHSEWFFQQRCGAHVINLIIKHALEDQNGCEDLAPMRALAVALHRTDRLRTILRGECDRLGLQYHLPPLPCDTRWGSTLNLLEGFIKIETALVILFRTNTDFLDHAWGDAVWELIRDLIALLQPFNELSKLLQGQDYPTIGLLGLGYDYIAARLESLANNRHSSAWLQNKARTFSRNALRYTLEWFSNGTATHWAVFMDPAVKDALLLRSGGPEASEVLRASLVAHLDTYYPADPSSAENVRPTSDFLSALQDFVGKSSNMSAHQELDSYLKEARVRAGSCALEYWKLAETRFPRLSRFARDILCIPATVAPSESAFSRSGQLITPRRNRLGTDCVRVLMCLDSWWNLNCRVRASPSTV